LRVCRKVVFSSGKFELSEMLVVEDGEVSMRKGRSQVEVTTFMSRQAELSNSGV
jgi:hypothetical protein